MAVFPICQEMYQLMNRGLPFLVAATLLLTSCEKSVDTPTDVDLGKPYLHDLMAYPGSFNTDTMLVNGGTNPNDILTITFACFVNADLDAVHPAPTVRYAVRLPAEELLYKTGALRDDGVSPDASAGDGLYSGTVSFTIRRVEIGRFEVAVDAYYEGGTPSNMVSQGITVARSSRPPVVSSLSAPDTVAAPGPGQVTLLLMTLDASDPDGQADLREVFFRNLDSPSDTTRKFFLLDDGHIHGLSGDTTANDGTYSIIVQLPYGTPAGTSRFLFGATDFSGLSSNTILHPITITNPE